VSKEFPKLEEFVAFVTERWNVHVKRSKGLQPPWTDDPILRTYRFCNIRREDDRVTKWIHSNWLKPNDGDPNVWFAMVIARLINKPESLDECGYPVPWRPAKWAAKLNDRKARGLTCFGGAYMIHADRHAGGTKVDYLAERVLTPIWEARKDGARVFSGDSLAVAHEWLMGFRDMGSFMSGQVVADAKWSSQLLRKAKDWAVWACPGPGSQRGLNRVMGRDIMESWKPGEWLTANQALRKVALPLLPKELRTLDAQNFNNSECEYDKWCRVKYDEGKRPKQLFKPSKERY
jgi:alpha-glutamyl/putrescinyl thymine pyrophosphorylase clade 1